MEQHEPETQPNTGAEAQLSDQLGALAAQTAAFASTFDRWSNRQAIAAGASIPRIKLLYSIHCNGPQKMADLAEALAVTPRNVTALVDALETEGLVQRTPHSTDRRVTLVKLTCDQGKVESQFVAYQASLARLFAELDEGDRQALARILQRLHDRMRAEAARLPAAQGEFDE